MADEFTMIGGLHQANVFDDYMGQQTGKYAEPFAALVVAMRHHHPEMTVTVTPVYQAWLVRYASAIGAVAELDTSEDGILRLRGFLRPMSEHDPGSLFDSAQFARYKYSWQKLEFIVYEVYVPTFRTTLQYILFPPDSDETVMSNSKATDALLMAVGQAMYPYREDREYILVFDKGYWTKSRQLYFEVLKTTWNDVILDQEMKDTISHTIEEFFDNERRYRDLDVPWKRGIIFYGPPGNGKTLSLRALMHSLSTRREQVNLLYVKSITRVWDIGYIFSLARAYSPCLLILEDIDTLVSGGFQSYFFNEVDGLAGNDGIMMIATTNHMEKLDGGIANRPSRFDRKYNFPNPDFGERILYSEFWRKKLQDNKVAVDFPEVLSPEIAKITHDFSFAYMKEAFIATLLAMARNGPDHGKKDAKDVKDGDDIEDLPFWKEMQREVKILRDEMRAKQEVGNIVSPPRFDLMWEANCHRPLSEPAENAPYPPPSPGPTINHSQRTALDLGGMIPYQPGVGIPGHTPITSSSPSPVPTINHSHRTALDLGGMLPYRHGVGTPGQISPMSSMPLQGDVSHVTGHVRPVNGSYLPTTITTPEELQALMGPKADRDGRRDLSTFGFMQ